MKVSIEGWLGVIVCVLFVSSCGACLAMPVLMCARLAGWNP